MLTGVAFLGAGAIIRRGEENTGLTTAANVFVVASIGIACGLSEWWVALFGWAFAFMILVLLQPLERWLEKLGRRRAAKSAPPPPPGKLEEANPGRLESLPGKDR